VLPHIAAAVGGATTIMLDGGVRRGADIVKALALGADLVLVGRAALYGVAAGGEPGVRRTLQILKSEVDRVLALLGCRSIAELGPQRLFGAVGRGTHSRPAMIALSAKLGSSSSSGSRSPG
jgi:isopentenyl diphosphate isomerase/L-lactate dehydrogenase-like FMN-dependent dehydrogenase